MTYLSLFGWYWRDTYLDLNNISSTTIHSAAQSKEIKCVKGNKANNRNLNNRCNPYILSSYIQVLTLHLIALENYSDRKIDSATGYSDHSSYAYYCMHKIIS